jgi:cytochrome c556
MSRFFRMWTLGSALIAAMAFLAVGAPSRADDDDSDKEIKEAQKDVLDLAKQIADGKDVQIAADKISKKYEDLNTIMYAFKPKAKKGIGVGAKGEGIEQKIQSMGKRAIPAGTLQKQKADLIKMAYINIAIANLTMNRPVKPKGGKGAKEWKEHTTEMKNSSLELIEAIKSGSSAKVKAVSTKLETSCNNCHTDFRD